MHLQLTRNLRPFSKYSNITFGQNLYDSLNAHIDYSTKYLNTKAKVLTLKIVSLSIRMRQFSSFQFFTLRCFPYYSTSISYPEMFYIQTQEIWNEIVSDSRNFDKHLYCKLGCVYEPFLPQFLPLYRPFLHIPTSPTNTMTIQL